MEAACADIVARAGRLAVWVNNAGVLHTGPAWEQDAATRDFMLDVNGRGVVNGTVAAIDAMRHTGGGHIVTTVSLAGITGEAVYAASKHAAIGFSLSTLGDLRQASIHDIDISCLCPDGIWTPMLHDELDDPGSAVSFSGRLLQPGEVARVFERILDRPRPVTVFPGGANPFSASATSSPGRSSPSCRCSSCRAGASNSACSASATAPPDPAGRRALPPPSPERRIAGPQGRRAAGEDDRGSRPREGSGLLTASHPQPARPRCVRWAAWP